MVKVAINGFGRIGRNILRAYIERTHGEASANSDIDFEIVAINDLGDPHMNAHLLKYDTIHGEFKYEVSVVDGDLMVEGHRITVCAQRQPEELPWAELGIDLVMECTGLFTSKEAASAHLKAGASRVLISAPAAGADATIVYGVNDDQLTVEHKVVSNASCTTNCLAPIAQALNDKIGIERGLVNTVHAYTNDQVLIDVAHSDPRRARAAGRSMIPSKTGAAAAIGLVIPELAGKLDGLAVRVPVLNVSLLDLTLNVSRETTVEEVNAIVTAAIGHCKGALKTNVLPLVSSDFNHNPASSTVDVTQTMVKGNLVKILAWYDNEWGFSNRMIDTAQVMINLNQDRVADTAGVDLVA